MRKFAKLTALVVMMMLATVLATACGQAASSASSASASSASAAPTKEELIAEVTKIGSFEGIESVSMDFDAKMSQSGGSATSIMSGKMQLGMADAFKMYATLTTMGNSFDIYTNGNNAVMVVQGMALGGTLQEMGLESFSSMDAIMNSQGASTANLSETLDSIEKTTEGEDTIYTMKFNPDKIAEIGSTMGTLSQGDLNNKPSAMTMVYHVNPAGQATSMEVSMDIQNYTMVVTISLHDYNATVVPDAPAPAMSFSEFSNLAAQMGQQAQ